MVRYFSIKFLVIVALTMVGLLLYGHMRQNITVLEMQVCPVQLSTSV